MKKSPKSLIHLFAVVFSVVLGSGVVFAQQFDPGNLTITVPENENGSVTISASGTANVINSGMFLTTTADPSESTPPATTTSDASIPLPPGITFTFPDNGTPESEEDPGAPLEDQADPITVPATTVEFSEPGVWVLGQFEHFLFSEDTVTGAGSVTVNTIPFSSFVPGTYVVTPTNERVKFISLFEVTYKVIPFTAREESRLTLESAKPFGPVLVGRSARTQTLRIRNAGGTTVTGIRSSLSSNPSDFRVRIVNSRPLNPGQSLVARVRFKPGRPGDHETLLSILSSAPTVSTTLTGEGVREINSPRFPRGTF